MAITVTATASAGTTGITLAVRQETNAAEAGGGSATANGTPDGTLTPASSGSQLLFACLNQNNTTTFTAATNNAFYDNAADATNGAGYAHGSYTGTVTGGTGVTVGATLPASSTMAAYEVQPSGGTIADSLATASVINTAGLTITTASFTPATGSVLAALVTAYHPSLVTTMTVSGGGLTWTERASMHVTGVGYVGVWTATVVVAALGSSPVRRPRLPGPRRGLPPFRGPFSIPGPPLARGMSVLSTIINDFETGTALATITNGSGGGSGDTAFDSVTKPAGATLIYDNTDSAHGTQCAHYTTDATGETCYVQWQASAPSANQMWFRLYYKTAANPVVNSRLIAMLQSSGTLCGYVQALTTGALQWVGQNGAAIVTTTSTVPTGTWVRVEGYLIGAATTGICELQYFASMDAVTPTETQTSGATAHTTGAPDTFRFGVSAATASCDYRLDDIGISNTGYIGPAALAAASGAATIAGAGAVATAAVQLPAGTAVSGAGAVATAETQAAITAIAGISAVTASGEIQGTTGTSISGSGAVAAAAQQPAVASIAGAGAVATAAVLGSPGTTLAGAGGVATAAVQAIGGTTITGAGAVAAASAGSQSGAASIAGAGAVSSAAVQLPVSTTVAGAGAVTTSAQQLAGTSIAGLGSVSSAETLRAGISVTGAGGVTSAVIQGAAATITGAGTVASGSLQQAGSVINGQGSVTAPAVLVVGITGITGTSSVTGTASGGSGGSSSITGTGTVSAALSSVLAGATVTGAGQVATGGVQGAVTAITGAGAVSAATIRLQAGVALAGAGAVGTAAQIAAVAIIAGLGAVSAAGNVRLPGAAGVAGAGSVLAGTERLQAGASIAGAGAVAAAAGGTTAAAASITGQGSVFAAGGDPRILTARIFMHTLTARIVVDRLTGRAAQSGELSARISNRGLLARIAVED